MSLRRITRFAPSPTGPLHLGHAASAAIAFARATPGDFLLRIEDIDQSRCRPQFETAIYEDLAWLGLSWRRPVMRQSDRLPAYRAALARLAALGLIYPCRCRRGDIRAALSAPQEGAPLHGPDGLIYPGTCRNRAFSDAGPQDALRLNMRHAMELLHDRRLSFRETGGLEAEEQVLHEEHLISHVGDVILSRKDMGTSYHLSVVVDDAEQKVTEVVRGHDLFPATAIHVVLQNLLGLPVPDYHHHRLIRDENGKRLAKRDDARALGTYREQGLSPAEVLRLAGINYPLQATVF